MNMKFLFWIIKNRRFLLPTKRFAFLMVIATLSSVSIASAQGLFSAEGGNNLATTGIIIIVFFFVVRELVKRFKRRKK